MPRPLSVSLEEASVEITRLIARDGGIADIDDIAAVLGVSDRTAARYVRILRTRGIVATAAGVRGVFRPSQPPARGRRCPACGQSVETL